MKKVLVIEDDAPLCWLLERILGQRYKVVVMSDGMEALSWMTEGNYPDLIISDINMPTLTGIELLENISNSRLYNDIPVVMLSAYEDPSKRTACMQLGAYHYMVKPFEPQQLLSIVDEAISSNLKTHA